MRAVCLACSLKKLSAEFLLSLSFMCVLWYNLGKCTWMLFSAFPLAVLCWASDDDGR